MQLVHDLAGHGRVLVGFDRVKVELQRRAAAGGLGFQAAQHGVGALDDRIGQAGQLGDLDAVAVVRRAGDDAAQEGDVLAALFDGDVVVFHPGHVLVHAGQLVVMGGEQRFAADVVADVFYHGAGDAHAVKRRGTAADLVQDDQAAAGGVLQNLRHFGHLDHEGGLPGGEVVRSADAGEDRIHNADMALRRGHKAADLRHQRNEGVLAHVGRFTGHVGAGDDEHAVFALVERCVVGHEQAALEHLLDDRVAAFGNVEHVAVVDGRLGIVVLHGGFGKGGEHIELGDGRGRALQPQDLRGNRAEQVGKQLVLQHEQPFVGAQNFIFKFLEFGRDVTLAGRQRLLAREGVRHAADIAAADLDIVAENLVEADLELGDASLLAQLGLHLRKHALAAVHDVAQFVDFGVVSGADGAAVLEVGGRVVDQGAGDVVKDVGQRVDGVGQLCQQRGVGRRGLRLDGGQLQAGIAQRLDLARGGGTVQDAGGQALDVKDVGERVLELGAADIGVVQRFDSAEPGVDGRRVDERLFDPGAQHALAHRGLGLVQHPEQRAALFPPAHRLGQLKVGARDRRQAHVLGVGIVLHGLDALDAVLLRLFQIAEQRAERRGGKAVGRKTGRRAPVGAELRLQGFLDDGGLVAGVLPQFNEGVRVLLDVVGQVLEVENGRVDQNFAGGEAAQLGNQRAAHLVGVQLGRIGFAGRDIGKADARFPAAARAFGADRTEVVVLVLGEHARFDDGAGRDNADDVPPDKPLGEHGVLHLLADGNLVALGDEPGDVNFIRVERHAAHGGALLPAAGLAGQRQLQLARGGEGVVVEHLVEIAHAVEQNLVGVLLLDLKILLHHGRYSLSGHGSRSQNTKFRN